MGRSAIVLAAGFGSRMKSKRHKVLHEVCGKAMIVHILDELAEVQLDQVIVVVGQQREAVEAAVAGRAEIAFQALQKGTGHAVLSAVPFLKDDIDTTVVLYGDAPLIRAETISRLLAECEASSASAAILTADVQDPTGLGRVIADANGKVVRVIEEKDATPEEKKVSIINTGIYAFKTPDLKGALLQLEPNNAQGEYYLTDTVGILGEEDKIVLALQADDADEIASVNDLVQLAHVEKILRRRINESWMRKGVSIVNPDDTYIGTDVTIGRDTVLWPGTILEGKTVIEEDCEIGPNSRLVDATVHQGARVEQSVVLQSEIGSETSVGPFAYIRPDSVVGSRVKIGDFVELKKSRIGDDTKVSHLAYVGDAQVGERVNIGCGVITVNYDGKNKHKTVIGNDAFVGSNVNLIAPIEVGDGAYLCAGSTITDNVPDDGFAIGRNRQVTKPDYVSAWKAGRESGQSKKD